MLKREIWTKLIDWKQRKHHPLVIRGLRQTGKTYIVRKFGEEFYDNTVYIDLRANRTIHHVFDGDFDVNRMVMLISAVEKSAKFVPGRTLIIFDEVQDCPNVRSSLKYWDTDGRYDVIATGSFLGVKGFREPYIRGVPVGYEEQMTMYPMSFTEFLDNSGIGTDIIDYIRASISDHSHIENVIHESIRSLYLQYLIVGGMPEAVDSFFETHDLNLVRRIQRAILASIRDDFGRYKDTAGNDRINEILKMRAEACLDSVPSQLSQEYKKFKFSLVNAKGHSPEKAEGLQYLEDVGLVIRAYNTTEIGYPLEGVKKPSEFKVYFIDTGLLVSQMGEEVPQRILTGDIGSYKGAIAENMVASAFAVNDMGLYYYHATSGSPELDFLFERNGNTVIVECKSTNNRATSMKYVVSHPNKYGHHPAIKLADTNMGSGDGYDTYPLYAAGFLKTPADEMVIHSVDVSNLRVPE